MNTAEKIEMIRKICDSTKHTDPLQAIMWTLQQGEATPELNTPIHAAQALRDILKELDERVKSSREWGDVLVSKDRRSEAEPYYWMAAGLEEFRNELYGQNASHVVTPEKDSQK